jgi:hypothetical protein
MAALASSLPADIEFVYIDAPSLAAGDFGWWHEGFTGWERTRDWITGQLSAGPRIDGLFADPLILEHSGGHIIPGDRAVAEPIARFLTRFTSTAPAGAVHQGTGSGP